MENNEHKDTRKQIMRRAESLFMRFGIKSVSMDDIARELGLSKKTLYQFFENKGDLILKTIESHLQEEMCDMDLIHSNAENALQEIMLLARHIIGQFQELSPSVVYDLKKYYPEAWTQMDKMQREHVYQSILDNLKRGIAEGDYRNDLNPEIMARLHVGSLYLPIDQSLFPVREFQPDQVFKEYIYHFVRGVASEQGLDKMTKYLHEAKQAIRG
jgi:hypothetical protein